MKKSQYNDEQGATKGDEAIEKPAKQAEVCLKHGVSLETFVSQSVIAHGACQIRPFAALSFPLRTG